VQATNSFLNATTLIEDVASVTAVTDEELGSLRVPVWRSTGSTPTWRRRPEARRLHPRLPAGDPARLGHSVLRDARDGRAAMVERWAGRLLPGAHAPGRMLLAELPPAAEAAV